MLHHFSSQLAANNKPQPTPILLLLGSTGYVGTAFAQLLDARSEPYRAISRRDVDYTDRDALIALIRDSGAMFLINAAGYTGKPNVDACEYHKADCLQGNAVLPGTVRGACEATEIPWGHVSSGCIYTGVRPDGRGFTEEDPPNFSFRTDNCSFYSGSKALGEECLQDAEQTYIWRLRIPFNHEDSGRNYLSKVMQYQRLLEAENSISHLNEFVDACLNCWLQRVPYGTYNVTNTGSITTRRVTELIQKHLLEPLRSASSLAPGTVERDRVRGIPERLLDPDHTFDFFADETEFMQLAAGTPRSNCVMDNTKLLATGIKVSPVEEAIEQSLRNWQWERKERLADRS